MKTSDIGIFGSCVKDALLKWSDQMVDNLLPNSASRRTIVKNAIGNAMGKYGSEVNKAVESIFMFLGDKNGSIDTDTVVDMICDLLKEMSPADYDLGIVKTKVGNGEVQVHFPTGFISEFVFGNLGGFKITPDDIQEIKKFLND